MSQAVRRWCRSSSAADTSRGNQLHAGGSTDEAGICSTARWSAREKLRTSPVESGRFGANMQVS
jgi:hypothetical protein